MGLPSAIKAFVPLQAVKRTVIRVVDGHKGGPRKGGHYFCAALSGESAYNISINSDLTVSCCCQDVDGSGRLGDLAQHSLREILDGPVARRFRRTLADGGLPTPICSGCQDLRHTDVADAARRVEEYEMPLAGIMIENTSACNYECTSCNREAVARTWTKRYMSRQDMQRASSQVRELGIRSVSFFKLGEPFLSGNVKEELAILRADNPSIHIGTSTNGSLLNTDDKRDAALMMDHIVFSIDGPDQQSLERYQVGGDFEAAVANLAALAAYRNALGRDTPILEWQYLLFNWNDRREQIDRAIAQARVAGADLFSIVQALHPRLGQSIRYRLNGYAARVGESDWTRASWRSSRLLNLREEPPPTVTSRGSIA